MRKAAVVMQTEHGPAEAAYDVEIGRFRRQSQRERGVSGSAIEACATKVRAEEQVGYGFQVNWILTENDANTLGGNFCVALTRL